ncbi:MAG: hypothetical protein IMZ47_07590 [Firmicutes bacterium]|nr:hypothetical protein [Bacillota bacterium]
MAELYPCGIQRIFYRTSVREILAIRVKMLDPSLGDGGIRYYSLIKVPGTLATYFADVNFYAEGIWIAVFYENGVERTVQAYSTKKVSITGGSTTVTGNAGSRGPNVIGGSSN